MEALDYKTPMPQWNSSDSDEEEGDGVGEEDELGEEDEEEDFECSLAELTGGDPSLLQDVGDNPLDDDDSSDDDDDDDGAWADAKADEEVDFASNKVVHEEKGNAKFEKLRREAGKRIAPATSSQLHDDEEAAHVNAAQRTSTSGRVIRPRIHDDFLY